MNAIKCDGNRMTKKVRKTLRVIGDDALPFLMEMERIVDVTNRKIICVVMRRPVYELGNVWRYLRYIFNQFVLVYTDETNMVRHLDVLQTDVCKNILPMEEESDTAAYCNSYSFKPMYVSSITGALGVEAYNVFREKYVMSPQAIYTGEDFNVSVQHLNVPDGCKDTNCSTGSQCIQSCQQIYSSNDYYCKETTTVMAILHEGTTHVELPTTTTIFLGEKSNASRGKSADDSTTLPYVSGEMDENYETSEYYTSTTADVETNGKAQGGTGEKSVNSSTTRQDEIPSLVKDEGKIHKNTTKLRKPFIYSNAVSTGLACFPSIITFIILNMFHRFYNDF